MPDINPPENPESTDFEIDLGEAPIPSADDAAVRALAEAAVEDALLRRARMLHVQWKQWI